MKTTLNIDETVMKQLREAAAKRGTTMSALVEAGIRRVLSPAPSTHKQDDALTPLPAWHSGGARVDISNREELYRVMDED
ncbi:MAG: hypothetical protein F4147_01860 [Gammaproteobacteria bacterium]|nr:hypothetical protein [Gammaproteobacteria bacterium]